MILSKASDFITTSVEVLKHEDENTLEGALYRKALEMEQNLTRQIMGQNWVASFAFQNKI